jgi:hypothetical protein
VKKVFTVLAFAAVGSMSAFGAEFKGTVADAMCNVKHIAATADDQACVKKCVKGPGDVVLITPDSKVLKIDEASFDKIKPHLGHKVTIQGKVNGDVLTVDSVKM